MVKSKGFSVQGLDQRANGERFWAKGLGFRVKGERLEVLFRV